MSAHRKAIRQVPQEHSGKHTPGSEGGGCETPPKRLALWQEGLSLTGYPPKPVKRCSRPKRSGGHSP